MVMQKQSHYEISRDKKGEYRWKLVSPNGEAVAMSEGYKTRRAVTESVKKMKVWATTDRVSETKPKRAVKKA